MICLKASGTSMYPTIKDGDTLLIKEMDSRWSLPPQVVSGGGNDNSNYNKTNIGEILLYEISGKFFVHRLIWKTWNVYLMKADTHFFFEKIDKLQVKGKVKAVIRNGRITDLTMPLNKILSFLLGFCLLPVSFVYEFICRARLQPCMKATLKGLPYKITGESLNVEG